MSESIKTSTVCGYINRSWFTKCMFVVSILIITAVFIFPKYVPSKPLLLPSKLLKPFSHGNVSKEKSLEPQHGVSVGACAQDAVFTDLRRMKLNPKMSEPYTGIDVLKMSTPPYSADYKNPCWVDETTKRLRCLPYFLLAGIAKSGTTNLYWSIAQHPQVRLPSNKEPQWWARRTYRSPLQTYIKFFDASTKSIKQEYKMIEDERYHRLVTGDGSPSTGYDFFHWKSITQNKKCTGEPGVVVPHLIKHIIPQAKVIFILRNPADRLLAGYIHWRRGHLTTPEHFHGECVRKLKQFKECRKLHSDRHCTYNRSIVSVARMLLQRSMYAVFIKDWLRVFPRKQMHFVQYEDYVQHKVNVLEGVFKFLDLDPVSTDDMKNVTATRGINTHRFKMAPMLNKTRRMLEDFFKPYNEQLSTLIGDPKFKFLNTKIPQNDPSGKNDVLPHAVHLPRPIVSKEQTAIRRAKGQTAIRRAKEQTAIQRAKGQTAIRHAKGQTAIRHANRQTAIRRAKGQTAIRRAKGQTAIRRAKGQTAIRRAKGQTAIRRAKGQTAIRHKGIMMRKGEK